MRRFPNSQVMVAALACCAFMVAPRVSAWKQFQDAWQDHYLDGHDDEEFVKHCRKKVKCHVCHQGRKKSNNNPYGQLFVGKLTKDDRKDTTKIIAVIKEIGLERSDSEDDSSPTFDEMVAASKLPGGDLKQCKKEPGKHKD